MVLLVNIEQNLAAVLKQRLHDVGTQVYAMGSGERAEHLLAGGGGPALALLSISRLNWQDDVALIKQLRKSGATVIAIARNSCEEMAIEAFRAGAANYFSLPMSSEEIWRRVRDHLAGQAPAPHARSGTRVAADATSSDPGLLGAASMVGSCAEMRRVKTNVARLSRSECNVLITGETGTGKELVAKLIHYNSRRADGPLVSLNCAAVPDSLIESELFGFERGAFTGAHRSTPGHIEQAAGGTILFDEVGEMSPQAQAKLLRALDTKEVYRLGSRRRVRVDTRVIAATNRNLDGLAAHNEFRRDLYYRLNVGRIHVPPLRQRRSDIPALVTHLLAELSREPVILADDVRQAMMTYEWPGNVRELRNVLESSLVGLPESAIRFADLPDWFKSQLELQRVDSSREPDHIVAVLEKTRWNKTHAARTLNWSRTTLYRKLDKYNLR